MHVVSKRAWTLVQHQSKFYYSGYFLHMISSGTWPGVLHESIFDLAPKDILFIFIEDSLFGLKTVIDYLLHVKVLNFSARNGQ